MNGAELIAAERQRQIDVEGWTPEHDAEHDRDELINAARCYIAAAWYSKAKHLTQPMPEWARDQAAPWPWDKDSWKPSEDPVRNLVKAGALVAAEIDRLQPPTKQYLMYVDSTSGTTGWRWCEVDDNGLYVPVAKPELSDFHDPDERRRPIVSERIKPAHPAAETPIISDWHNHYPSGNSDSFSSYEMAVTHRIDDDCIATTHTSGTVESPRIETVWTP